MPKQPAFPSLRNAMKKKVTRRELFLAQMDVVVPWGRLLALIEPQYPKAGPKGGRPPMALEVMHPLPGPGQEPRPAVHAVRTRQPVSGAKQVGGMRTGLPENRRATAKAAPKPRNQRIFPESGVPATLRRPSRRSRFACSLERSDITSMSESATVRRSRK